MDTKCVILKRMWSVVLAAAGLFTAPLSATLQAEEAASVTAKDAVAVPEARESVLADVTAGASARKVMKGSQTYVWDETNVIKVNSADELNSALSTSGGGHKSIRIMNSFDIRNDIESPIDATIDLNGKTLSSYSFGHTIHVAGGSLSLFDGSTDGDGSVVLYANTVFIVDEFGMLNIYGGKFSGYGEGSAVINHGTTNVYGGNFADLKKGIDNAAGTLNIYGGEFSGDGSGTGVYNSGTANVYGGKFENLVMGIYNAGSLNLYALPVVGAGNKANSTADIGLAPGNVITMAMVGSSLPENYEKMKVGQFTYTAGSGYSAAGSAPYVVTSGYQANVKGIHPAQMFVAYDGDATDDVSYELCLKGGSDADAGEAQIAEVAEHAVTWTNPGGDGGGGGINILLPDDREWADGAVIRLNRNIDLGAHCLCLEPDDTRTNFTFDLNGHLLIGGSGSSGIFEINGMKVTICDSGTGAMMAVNRGNSNSAVYLINGSLTITGGSFFSEGAAIDNKGGTLSVTGGTLTGEGGAVLNRGGGTADISGGTIIGANGVDPAIENAGTMTLGCGDGAVSIIGGSGSSAVGNRGTLTVGSHASIKSSGRAAINNSGTLNVAGFPSFDAANACDVMLFKFFDNSNSFISFTGDITAAPAAPLKVTVADDNFQPVALGDEPLLITSGYGAHVRYASGEALAGFTRDAGEVFTLINGGTDVLVFAGGEAWRVSSGTIALIQTSAGVTEITSAEDLASAVDQLLEDATVMLADDVSMGDNYLWFQVPGKSFTLDLGGHKISGSSWYIVYVSDGALLDITDSEGGGCIKSIGYNGRAIYNDHSDVSIEGLIKLEAVGTYGVCLEINGGTTTFKGLPTFEHGNDFLTDIKLTEGDVISFADGEISLPYEVIFVNYEHEKYGIMTSGYSAHVKYPAGHEKAGNVIDPNEIFYYYAHDAYAGSTRMYLVTVGDGEEVSVGPQKIAVAYVDETGRLHDDLTNPGGTGEKDAALAFILDGTEKTLGKSGTDTWYVALPSLPKHDNSGYTHVNSILLNGDVHLVLADGCDMGAFATTGYGCFLGDASTSLTIYAQSDGQKKGKLTTDFQSDGTAAIRAGTVTINGGNIDLSANPIYDCYAIYADGGGLTFNGGEVRSLEKYGFYANDCGITVNGGNIRALKERDNGIGIYCQTTGGHTIDINGGTVIAEGDKAGIWATNDINIKSNVSAVGTGIGSYAIYSAAGDINISGGKVTADASNPGYYGIYSNAGTVSITAGQVKANGVLSGIYAKNDIFISLNDATEFLSSNQYSVESGGVKIPRGQYLGVSDLGCVLDEACGSADADYVFDVPGNTTLNYISGKTLKKAYPVVGSGKYMACDRTDGYWLLGDGTVALYPTGVKFNKKLDGTITAEVILSETPLAGVPKDRAVILASATEGNDLGTFALTCANESSGDGITSSNIRDDYDSRSDRLPNFIATDGAKTFAELISGATGTTVSTAEQARDYLVFTLTGDRFVPITFAYNDTPAAGHCLLVVPKINILLHEDIPAPAGGGSSGARRISLGGGESDATGVIGVKEVSEGKDDTYFGLDGRPVGSRPQRKGVYIRRGSKLIVR